MKSSILDRLRLNQKIGKSTTYKMDQDVKILRPRIRQIVVHERITQHIEEMCDMGFDAGNWLPESMELEKKSKEHLECLAKMSIFYCVNLGGQINLITGLEAFFRCRAQLPNDYRIRIFLINNSSESLVDEIFFREQFLNHLLVQSIKKNNISRLWTFKKYFERKGILQEFGLDKIPVKTWAEWFGCDRRILK